MAPILKYKKVKLNNSIVPQVFIKKDDGIIYFDRINPDEARFCILDDNGEKNFEVSTGQGIITLNGDMYIADIKNGTILKKYLPSGEVERSIKIEGIFYDFKISAYGELICLGNIGSETVIKIYSNNFNEMCTIFVKDIFFGSCIFLEEDKIYVAGFDKNMNFEIVKINYIGSMLNKWHIDYKYNKKIIVKMEKYKNYFIMLTIGKKGNMMLYDADKNILREIYPDDFEIENFLDFNIYGDTISILGERYILDVQIEDILNYNHRKKIKKFIFQSQMFYYTYAMYYSNLSTEILFLCKYTVPFVFVFYIISLIIKFPIDILALLYFLPILNFTIASIKSFILFLKKSKRIEQLLYINQFEGLKDINILPFYMSLTVFCIEGFINYPNFYILPNVLIAILFYFTFYYISKFAIEYIKNNNDSIVIELLKSDDLIFKEYINNIVRCLKEKKSEKILIEIIADEDINSIIPLKWQRSRKSIIRGFKFDVNSNCLKTLLDFSKRDIKYSRIGILTDYISYMKNEINIKKIKMDIVDKDSQFDF
ncbi:hypothetical protein FDN13_10140 [Caloramator sp. E03]|uniref:hypothetical protein n=1 Tax=Caloramator sp. E03 TaxID=2576307 RepID=UPI001110C813|nr:hypothetical protein [Caloramator sp. E03]QCX34038.1 hypothetical protein FDN13_10140 [Caloramator sp. E03]